MENKNFEERISDLIDRLDAAEALAPAPAARFPWKQISAAACVAAIAVAAVLAGYDRSAPEDTFTDPLMAYAEVEKAFSRISSEISRNTAKAGDILQKQENTISDALTIN